MGRGPQAYPYGFWCFPVKCFPKKPEFPEFPVTPLFKGLPLIVVKPIEFFVFLVVDLTTPSEIALSYLHLPWETATCGCYTPFSFPKVAIPWAFFLWNFQRTLPHAFGNKALVAVFLLRRISVVVAKNTKIFHKNMGYLETPSVERGFLPNKSSSFWQLASEGIWKPGKPPTYN